MTIQPDDETEDRRSTFRALVAPERQLAVIRRGRREYTVWMRNVSAGGIGFAVKATSRFRREDKVVVVTSSGTFEGRVAHVTPAEPGIVVIGVERQKVLEKLHAEIVERGDLPRSSGWLPSLIGWTATSAVVCAGLFLIEASGTIDVQKLQASFAAPAIPESRLVQDELAIAARFRRIDALLDPAERERLAMSPRQEEHVVAIAEQTAIRLASILVSDDGGDRSHRVRSAQAALSGSERRIEETLAPGQEAAWLSQGR